MAELTREQHELKAGSWSVNAFFGGFIAALGRLFVPNQREENSNRRHYEAIVNLMDGIDRRLSNAFSGYVYLDSTDTALQFSVTPFTIDVGGVLCIYAGAVNINGLLVAGATRYIYANLSAPPAVTIASAAAWPATPHIKLAAIAAPASGFWLPQHLTRSTNSQAASVSGGGAAPPATLDFAFNTASPAKITRMALGVRAWSVVVVVDTAFNGAAPVMTVGDAGDNDRLVVAADVNLKVAGRYEIPTSYKFAADTDVNVYLTPDGSTAGAASVRLE